MRTVTSVGHVGSWETLARCLAADADVFFATGAAQEQRAKAVCSSCPVRWECLAYALRHRVDHGVWGGLSDRERRRILNRARPASWDPDTAMRVVGQAAS